MNTVTIFNVADWFLCKESMTPKKLQKLVYYAYAWYLTLVNDSSDEEMDCLFKAKAEAWVHGPVFPNLYSKYKKFGGNTIPKNENEYTDCEKVFNEDQLDILEQVWDVYGHYNGNQLESITHQEKPWLDARGDCSKYEICQNQISDKSIFDYYIKRIA